MTRIFIKKISKKYSKKFQKRGLGEFYKNLYSSGRLSEDTEAGTQNLGSFLDNYTQNLRLIDELVRENHRLQLWVHRLGIKNRAKKTLGLYRPPENVDMYVSPSELDDILRGAYVTKNYLPLASFSIEALESFKSLSEESFEEGLRKIQSKISAPLIKNPPLVSVIIPTRDGLDHLKKLFVGFEQSTIYPKCELIVVDNASRDGTQEYLKQMKERLNLRVIRNTENKSFSASNNAAAKQAKGKYLLFLNNDVSPTDGWLSHMMSTALRNDDAGAVGAKLVYPYKEGLRTATRSSTAASAFGWTMISSGRSTLIWVLGSWLATQKERKKRPRSRPPACWWKRRNSTRSAALTKATGTVMKMLTYALSCGLRDTAILSTMPPCCSIMNSAPRAEHREDHRRLSQAEHQDF